MTYCNEKRMPCEWAQIGGGCSVSVCQKVPLTVVGWPMPTEQPEFVKPPMTNADRIRAMSDEEIAQWMLNGISDDPCDYCEYNNGYCDGSPCRGKADADKIIEWLQQPAEEVHHE